MLGLGQKGLVGLDIGSTSVKVCELESMRQGMRLKSLALEALPADTVVDGAIMDANAVVNCINRIFTSQKIVSDQVATSVSGHSVICKRIQVPNMTEDELRESIDWEAEQHIPFDISDVNLDFQVLRSSTPNQLDVLLVAVKKGKILNQTQALIQAGRRPRIVDVDAFAVQNAYEWNYQPGANLTVALLNIGASLMNISVIKDGEPLFTRDISVGGHQYTDALQKELGLSFEEAEQLKLGAGVDGKFSEQRKTLLNSVSEILMLEIQKTFDFFKATIPGGAVQRIYLSGGCARVEGLLDLLKRKFAVPVEELNPFKRLIIDESKLDPRKLQSWAPTMAVSVGLALRGFDKL